MTFLFLPCQRCKRHQSRMARLHRIAQAIATRQEDVSEALRQAEQERHVRACILLEEEGNDLQEQAERLAAEVTRETDAIRVHHILSTPHKNSSN